MHAINLDNVSDDEVFAYPLIILKGTVAGDGNGCASTDEIFVNGKPHRLFNGNFKILLELENGRNTIDLKFCCASREIRLVYTPRTSDLLVQPVYVVFEGHSGQFQAPPDARNDPENACSRITTCCKLLQTVCAEKLAEQNFPRKTFRLAACKPYKSKLESDEVVKMGERELWSHLGREILGSNIGSEEVKYLAFISCTEYHGGLYRNELVLHEDLVKITDGYVALGGGGLAIFGTGCLYTWPVDLRDVLPRFTDETVVDKTKYLDDSAYRGTYGGCFSTTLGSVLHELCHTFDLGHTDIGIMGRGFDNIQNIFLPSTSTSPRHRTTKASSSSGDQQVSIKIRDADTKSFIRRPHQFSNEVINKTNTTDDTFFTRSGACILAYHKWFNDYPPSTKKEVLTYDKSVKLLKSTAGIRVVELRTGENEMVTESWWFGGKILKYSFRVDEEHLEGSSPGQKVDIFVEDNSGDILKTEAV